MANTCGETNTWLFLCFFSSEVPDSGVDFFYVSPQEAYLLMKNDKACGRDLGSDQLSDWDDVFPKSRWGAKEPQNPEDHKLV